MVLKVTENAVCDGRLTSRKGGEPAVLTFSWLPSNGPDLDLSCLSHSGD